jgi:hypothetical protein
MKECCRQYTETVLKGSITEHLKHSKYNIYFMNATTFLQNNLIEELKGKIIFFDIEATFNDSKQHIYYSSLIDADCPADQTKPMLFQLMAQESDTVYVLDVWNGSYTEDIIYAALKILGELDKSGCQFVIHNGKYFDIPVLYNFYIYYHERVSNLFNRIKIIDTFDFAINVKQYEHGGLKSLLKRFFSLEIDKKLQKADWSLRPLTEEQLLYAGLDCVFLEGIYNYMVINKRYKPAVKPLSIEDFLSA